MIVRGGAGHACPAGRARPRAPPCHPERTEGSAVPDREGHQRGWTVTPHGSHVTRRRSFAALRMTVPWTARSTLHARTLHAPPALSSGSSHGAVGSSRGARSGSHGGASYGSGGAVLPPPPSAFPGA